MMGSRGATSVKQRSIFGSGSVLTMINRSEARNKVYSDSKHDASQPPQGAERVLCVVRSGTELISGVQLVRTRLARVSGGKALERS